MTFACSDPNVIGPRLLFQTVPEGKVVKNPRAPVRAAGTGLVGGSRRSRPSVTGWIELGAVCERVMLADGVNESCIVMQDIEGNEFCLD